MPNRNPSRASSSSTSAIRAGLGALPADEGARGRAQRPVRPVRRHRPGRLVAVRRPDQHADAAEAGGQRPDVLAVAHDRALLADPLDLPDRTQPSPQRHGLHHRGGERLPRRATPASRRVRHDGADPAGRRLEHLLAGQEPQRARAGLRSGASRKQWPLNKGFDRFYGFLGGETNNGIPDLVEDNQFIDQPYTPGGGLSPLQGSGRPGDPDDPRPEGRATRRGPGTCGSARAPTTRRITCPQEYIDKYKGKFDDGYEAYREWVLPRMIEKGILPEGHQLTPINPMPDGRGQSRATSCARGTRSTPTRRSCSRRLAEVYAGFSEYTDAQVGRIIDYLEQTGQLDNTLVIYAADNGASGEGSPNGSVNENKFFNGYPDELAENLKLIDVLGGPDTYEHYPTGWAVAFSTPFKMFKRYSEYAGGTCDPLVISLAEGHQGARRGPQSVSPLHRHRPDDPRHAAGWRCPRSTRASSSIRSPASRCGTRFDASRRADAEEAPVLRDARHPRHLGGRLEGRRRPRARLTGKGHFDKDVWELYHVDVDRSESKNLAKEHPEKLQALIAAWFEEAEQEPGAAARRPHRRSRSLNIRGPSDEPPRDTLHLLPGHVAGAGRRRGQRARPLVQDPRRRRDHRSRTARA